MIYIYDIMYVHNIIYTAVYCGAREVILNRALCAVSLGAHKELARGQATVYLGYLVLEYALRHIRLIRHTLSLSRSLSLSFSLSLFLSFSLSLFLSLSLSLSLSLALGILILHKVPLSAG